MPLLFDRRRFGVALRDDDAAQVGTMLARHVLPNRLAPVIAELHGAAGLHGIQEDAPAILGHFHVAEIGPAVALDADGSAQVNVEPMAAVGAGLAPPVDEARLPV